ncbi:hypothetical protein DPMN_172014 [Dreissena polymorpha]|uniref:Uncharacterized protein n=1 Tax=Dreissena polymorpha TaxID=45954 RepID=A0A9D4ICY4_DREPO|nr:hypothetical protein DPMN_192733 [Dreissena polymorpha]KAH3770721.1 hypothetical protein DPMN_172014 [Dreissena polymorpha]
MVYLDATSRRPEPQNDFPSTLIVLSTAVLEHFHYLTRTTASKSWPVYVPMFAPPVLYSANAAAPVPLETHYPHTDNNHSVWRSFQVLGVSQQVSEGTSVSSDDGTGWTNRAVSRSSPNCSSSDDVLLHPNILLTRSFLSINSNHTLRVASGENGSYAQSGLELRRPL